MKTFKSALVLIAIFLSYNLYAQQSVNEDAIFVEQKMQTNIEAGRSYSASVTFKNSGKKTWRKGQYWIIYTDPRMSAMNNNIWGIDSIPVKKNVKPGSTYEFKFNINSPPEPGIYFFSWMMCNENGTFGLGSEMQQIIVTK